MPGLPAVLYLMQGVAMTERSWSGQTGRLGLVVYILATSAAIGSTIIVAVKSLLGLDHLHTCFMPTTQSDGQRNGSPYITYNFICNGSSTTGSLFVVNTLAHYT